MEMELNKLTDTFFKGA